MNTKLHAVADAQGRPISLCVTAGRIRGYNSGTAALLRSFPQADRKLADRGDDASVLSAGRALAVLVSSRQDLDAISAFVVSSSFLPTLPAGDAGAYALVLQRISEPVGNIAAIRQHSVYLWKTAQQGGGSAAVTDVAARDTQACRAASGIGNCPEFGGCHRQRRCAGLSLCSLARAIRAF